MNKVIYTVQDDLNLGDLEVTLMRSKGLDKIIVDVYFDKVVAACPEDISVQTMLNYLYNTSQDINQVQEVEYLKHMLILESSDYLEKLSDLMGIKINKTIKLFDIRENKGHVMGYTHEDDPDIINIAWQTIYCPKYVTESLLVHEATHLLQFQTGFSASHDDKFWEYVISHDDNYYQARDWRGANEYRVLGYHTMKANENYEMIIQGQRK